MHESDAMEFIEMVLFGFLKRNFEEPSGVDTYVLYQPLLKKIRAFVRDETGHWVKGKAFWVVHFIESMETQANQGRYNPVSPESCVETILDMSFKRMNGLIETYQLKENAKRMQDFFPLPVLPKKK
jgi:hypothetical protein